MFSDRLKRFRFINRDIDNIGRVFIFKERASKKGNCPLYQLVFSKEKKIISKVNLQQVELCMLITVWENQNCQEFYNYRRKFVKIPSGFQIFHLQKDSDTNLQVWLKKEEVIFTKAEEDHFLKNAKFVLPVIQNVY
jgi:hypothetical protein